MRRTNIPEGHSFGSILKEYRMKAGLTQQALADRLGVVRNTVLYWESDKKNPSIDTLKEICRVLGIPVSELLRGDMSARDLNADERQLVDKFDTLNYSNQKLLLRFMDAMIEEQAMARDARLRTEFSVFGVASTEAAAGAGTAYSDVADSYCFLRVSDRSREADWVVGVTGNSMLPAYKDGEKVFVRQTEQVYPGDIVVVNTSNGLVIKLFNDDHKLESLNPNIPFEGSDSETYSIMGKVVGKVTAFDQPTKAEEEALSELLKTDVEDFCVKHSIPV